MSKQVQAVFLATQRAICKTNVERAGPRMCYNSDYSEDSQHPRFLVAPRPCTIMLCIHRIKEFGYTWQGLERSGSEICLTDICLKLNGGFRLYQNAMTADSVLARPTYRAFNFAKNAEAQEQACYLNSTSHEHVAVGSSPRPARRPVNNSSQGPSRCKRVRAGLHGVLLKA